VVRAGQPSDPYLMTGYDRKLMAIRTASPAKVRVEVDITGTGLWQPYRTFDTSEISVQHHFPDGFNAYWIRFVADRDSVATASLKYD
jgi:hypothetical protein